MIATVLVADDCASYREIIRECLREQPGFQALGEACNGFEAVQLAEMLKPTIVLLDISMPWMNGIEAARQILRISPASQIAFLTAVADPEVARAVIGIGAMAYVLKSHLHELPAALRQVMMGRKYVCSCISL